MGIGRWIVLASVVVTLGQADIERALSIGRASDAERARFHRRYILAINDPTVEQIEIFTPFRRAVVFAEERIRQGDHLFGLRQAEPALRPWQDKLTLAVRLRFHPLNTYVMVPEFTAAIGSDPALAPLDVRRQAILGTAAPNARQGTGQAPILGALIEADFDARAVGQAPRPVRIILDRKDVAKLAVRFGEIQ